MKIPSSSKGFTLIEAVVATSVFAFVVSSILGVYISAIQLDRKTRSQRAVTQNARYIMEFLAKEVRNGTIDYTHTNNATNLYLVNQASEAEHFIYDSTNQILQFSKNAASATNLNSAAVKVTNFKFFVQPAGNPFVTGSLYNEQPRITVILGLQSNLGSAAKDQASVGLQDTFVTRTYPSRQ